MKTILFSNLPDGATFKFREDSKSYQKVLEDDINITAFEVGNSSVGIYVPDRTTVLVSE